MTDPREAMYRDPVSQARGLAAIASAAGIEAALREGARHLAAVSGARLSALYYVRDGEIVREALHPEDVAGQVEAVVAAKRAALAAAAGEPGGTAEEHRATRVPVDGDGAATLAEFVIWVRAGEAPEPPEVVALADAALTLLAARLGASAAGERTRARQEQYERWFQTLDAQLRILDRERQKFAAIANQPDSYAFVTDGTRTVRWHNKALATLLGGGEPDWVGHACHEVCGRIGLVDGPEGCARCPVRRAFDTNASCQVEVRRGEGADERDLYLIALPIKGPDGKPLEVLGEIRDVTNLEVVRRAKERLETVVAGAPIVLFAIDANGRFTLSVGKGLEPLGLAPGEVVGRSVFEMYRDVPEIVDSIRRALAGDTLTRRVDVGSLSFDSTFAPLRNADGRVVGMIGVSTDVTERRRAEEALRRSEEELRHAQRIEAIGSLAGGVAHDFNNLLTALFGHLNFLRGRVTPGSDVAREVDAIGRAADRAATLTRQLLAFSRKQVLQPKAVDTNDVIRGMEPMLRRLIREDVELRITADAARPWIDADPGQIEQVVMNLVVNARDAMPQGGRLMIRTANVSVEADGAGAFPIPEGAAPPFEPRGPVPAGRYVVLSVQDSGIGMDATTQARAFEPFFTTKPQVGNSRGYIFRKGKLVQMTRDQSLIGQLIEEGTLTEEQA
ncbi:MAG: PAS domain-containing protein, partial [Hyphomicrobiales bacterium]